MVKIITTITIPTELYYYYYFYHVYYDSSTSSSLFPLSSG
jgi:hypothetical protein